VALAVVVAGCGDSGSESSDSSNSTTAGAGTGVTTTAGKQPQTGGTVTFGSYSKIFGLDPLVALGHGTSGGIPMIALYDTLTRWNPTTQKYDMRMAESVTPNADNTEWTVKIKPNIKFTDGSDYDAEVVKFGINRHRVGLTTVKVPVGIGDACKEFFACPRNAVSSSAYVALIDDIQVVDKLTLKFMLNEQYSAFPFILSAEAGMIPSKAALTKACTDPSKPPSQCSFNLAPVGAGAFMVDSYKAEDSIKMVRNPNFIGGQAYLDGLTFLDKGDAGGQNTYESLKAGTTQAAFLRDPAAVAQAKADKFPGFSTMNNDGGIILLNMGVLKADGTPTNPATKDLRVRQAIQAAIDLKGVNERGYQGKAQIGGEIFQSSFPWNPGVPGPKYDLDTAKRLVSEAKAAGWNGNLNVLFSTGLSTVGQTVTSMLQLAGINATLDLQESTVQQTRVTTTKDFEVAYWGISVSPDDYGIFALTQNLRGDAPSNRVGFKSALVDQALKDVRSAKTDDARKAAYKVIAEEVIKNVPFVTFAAIEEYNAYSPKLNGIVGAGRSYVFFDKAWLEK
jgi:peptide/nickel transport system substrate-binding protein